MRKAIAIDFDGCLCEWAWPEIGAPHMDVINAAIQEGESGTALILWACREGSLLESAVDWCSSYGLEFDAVNANLPERIAAYRNDCRKVSADEYWDDHAVHMPEPPNDPLTLDELREMDGEPVWVTRLDCWKVCYGLSEFRGYLCMETGNGSCINMESYGKWLAYRHKPKEV